MGGRPLLVDAILYEILDFGDGPTAAVPLPIKRYRRKRIRITASLQQKIALSESGGDAVDLSVPNWTQASDE
jgi:hypothetical protein